MSLFESTSGPSQPQIDVLLRDQSYVPVYLQRRIVFRESTFKHGSSDSLLPVTGRKAITNDYAHKQVLLEPRSTLNAPSSHKVLFPKERIISDMMSWHFVYHIGPGLVNLSNTCFLNATLQCLTYIPPFANYLLSKDHSTHCESTAVCILCEMESHILYCLRTDAQRSHSKNAVHCPKGIVGNLKIIAKHMKFGRQEDAHEFTRFLIDALQKNALHGLEKKLSPRVKQTSVIHQIFGGYFSSRIACSICHNKSDTFDCFLDVCLDIRNSDSLERAFRHFIAPEKLSHANAYECSKCNRTVEAEKKITIKEAPIVLTIQFKRFAFKGHGPDAKITKLIHYSEHFNLSPYMTDSNSKADYTLCGVLVHSGSSCNSGHYYSFVKSPSQIWYSMNDTLVHPVGTATVLRQNAYMLFYLLKTEPLKAKDGPVKENAIIASEKGPEMHVKGGKDKEDPMLADLTFHSTMKALKVDRPIIEDTTMRSVLIDNIYKIQRGDTERNIKNGIDAASEASRSDITHSEIKTEQPKQKLHWLEESLESLVKRPLISSRSSALYNCQISPWTEGSFDNTSLLLPASASKADILNKPVDEYDEEYDRGKVKKLKLKAERPSGPYKGNPFQRLVEGRKKATEIDKKFFNE